MAELNSQSAQKLLVGTDCIDILAQSPWRSITETCSDRSVLELVHEEPGFWCAAERRPENFLDDVVRQFRKRSGWEESATAVLSVAVRSTLTRNTYAEYPLGVPTNCLLSGPNVIRYSSVAGRSSGSSICEMRSTSVLTEDMVDGALSFCFFFAVRANQSQKLRVAACAEARRVCEFSVAGHALVEVQKEGAFAPSLQFGKAVAGPAFAMD
jgi:hypothetical protein